MKDRMLGWDKKEVLNYISQIKERQQEELAQAKQQVHNLISQAEQLKAEISHTNSKISAVGERRSALGGIDDLVQELVREILEEVSLKLKSIETNAQEEAEQYRRLSRQLDEEIAVIENLLGEMVEDIKTGVSVFKAEPVGELNPIHSEDKRETPQFQLSKAEAAIGMVTKETEPSTEVEAVDTNCEDIGDDTPVELAQAESAGAPDPTFKAPVAGGTNQEPTEADRKDRAWAAETTSEKKAFSNAARLELEEKQLRFIVGNVAGADLLDEEEELIIARGENITREVALRAKSANRLVELVINMLPPGFEEDVSTH